MAATHFTDPNVCNWWTEGIKIGTTLTPLPISTVLADSGNMPQGTYRLHCCLAANVAAFVQLEMYDASVPAVPVLVQSMAWSVPVSGGLCDDIDVTDIGTPVRVKITVLTALVGGVQGVILNRA